MQRHNNAPYIAINHHSPLLTRVHLAVARLAVQRGCIGASRVGGEQGGQAPGIQAVCGSQALHPLPRGLLIAAAQQRLASQVSRRHVALQLRQRQQRVECAGLHRRCPRLGVHSQVPEGCRRVPLNLGIRGQRQRHHRCQARAAAQLAQQCRRVGAQVGDAGRRRALHLGQGCRRTLQQHGQQAQLAGCLPPSIVRRQRGQAFKCTAAHSSTGRPAVSQQGGQRAAALQQRLFLPIVQQQHRQRQQLLAAQQRGPRLCCHAALRYRGAPASRQRLHSWRQLWLQRQQAHTAAGPGALHCGGRQRRLGAGC